jgi:protein-S-isoprenylcysteine O-methyltransferase Ste14
LHPAGRALIFNRRDDAKPEETERAMKNSVWREWLSGKMIPLGFWTFFLTAKVIALKAHGSVVLHEGLNRHTGLEIVNDVLTLGFFTLVLVAYLTRSRAVDAAKGFWERTYPMLVFFGGVAGVFVLQIFDWPRRFDLPWQGVPFSIAGLMFSVWALWHLRGSFSIMAEARKAVTTGPYRLVRHPLYLGEALTMLGLCLRLGTITALVFWAAFNALQLGRAAVEEQKLTRQLPDYGNYRKMTRFIIPGLY